MTQRTLNYLLAAAIAALLATAHLLDGPDDIQTERAIAADLADAQTQAFVAAKAIVTNQPIQAQP